MVSAVVSLISLAALIRLFFTLRVSGRLPSLRTALSNFSYGSRPILDPITIPNATPTNSQVRLITALPLFGSSGEMPLGFYPLAHSSIRCETISTA
jgi:hypothetical protein